jgi:hypothetical protein
VQGLGRGPLGHVERVLEGDGGTVLDARGPGHGRRVDGAAEMARVDTAVAYDTEDRAEAGMVRVVGADVVGYVTGGDLVVTEDGQRS